MLQADSLAEFRGYCRELLGSTSRESDDLIDPRRLEAEFPRGYLLFAANGNVTRVYNPYPDRLAFDLSARSNPLFPRRQLNREEVEVVLPNITLIDRRTVIDSITAVFPRRIGAKVVLPLTIRDTRVMIEVLGDSGAGVIWVLGFASWHPSEPNTREAPNSR